jgi:hypothetical protein
MSVPGSPRLAPVVGGELPAGTPDPQELLLQPGEHDVGAPPVARLLVHPDGRVFLQAVTGPVRVDGEAVQEMLLHNGNRIHLPEGDVAFLCDWLGDDGGRQGGEQLHPQRDVDDLDRQ